MEAKRTCPECNLIFEAPLPDSGVLTCPLCNCTFAELVPATPAPAVPTAPAPATAASGRQVFRGVLALGALLFLAGGLVYAYHLMVGLDRPPAPPPAPTAHGPATVEPPPTPEIVVPVPPAPLHRVFVPVPKPKPPALREESRRPLTLPEQVNQAIERGVAFLRKPHQKNGHYQRYLGLLGLTLLECGIPTSDASIQEIAAWMRSHETNLTQTYDLTLAILFLDRLHEPRDENLIRTFGQRLLSGQLDCGAWTYTSSTNAGRIPVNPAFRAPSIITFPKGSILNNAPARRRIAYQGDNSNTQFAILGLWVAQRHGVPARSALLATERYFRDTQHSDGSWTYHPNLGKLNLGNFRDSMTCAGLMSLAMRYGVISGQGGDIRPRQPLSVHDAAVQKGLRYLARALDKVSVNDGRIVGVDARDPLYFLWSLERMAVIYDLQMIGEREWYPWAAQMLVQTQQPDGRWHGMGDPVATCFALLILKRSNFAHDLQLAVQQPPARPRSEEMGRPTIVQGRDAILGLTGKRATPPPLTGTTGTMGTTKLAPSVGPPVGIEPITTEPTSPKR